MSMLELESGKAFQEHMLAVERAAQKVYRHAHGNKNHHESQNDKEAPLAQDETGRRPNPRCTNHHARPHAEYHGLNKDGCHDNPALGVRTSVCSDLEDTPRATHYK